MKDKLGPVLKDAASIYAQHITTVKYADLPASVISSTKRSILDTLAVMLAGSGSDTARVIVKMLESWGGYPRSSILGYGIKLPACSAAFANGVLAHQFDFDNTHDKAVTHPTANSIPAALAVAEAKRGCKGTDLILAIALADDITCRLGLAINGNLFDYPFARPPLLGNFGAAVAAASILALSPQQVEWTFGLTLHQIGNTLEQTLGDASAHDSDVRGLRDGFVARNGVTAALMAREGVRGDISSLEGRFGLFNAYFRGEYSRNQLLDDLGKRFEGENVSIKPWPSVRGTHATIQAVIELMERNDLRAEAVQEVQLSVGKTTLEFCEPGEMRRRPNRRMVALNSLPYSVAVAICYGRIPLSAYSESGLNEERVLECAQRVTWVLNSEMSNGGTIEGGHVRIRLHNGTILQNSAPPGLGHPSSPISDAFFRQKLFDCAALASIPPSRREMDNFIATVDRLESSTVEDLIDALSFTSKE